MAVPPLRTRSLGPPAPASALPPAPAWSPPAVPSTARGKEARSPQPAARRPPEATNLPKVAVVLLLRRRGQESVGHAGGSGAGSRLRLSSRSGPRERPDPPHSAPPLPRGRPSSPLHPPPRGQARRPGDPAGAAKAPPSAPPRLLIGGWSRRPGREAAARCRRTPSRRGSALPASGT